MLRVRYGCFLLALLSTALGSSTWAAEADLSVAANALGVVSGGLRSGQTYTHSASAGVTEDLGGHWRVRGSLAWTAGQSLSAKSIGDVAGVQGTFNGGNAVWLYEASLQYEDDKAALALGRISASDSFGAIDGMSQFVNAAFSSSGGAISLNDPGRATSPSASWGVRGRYKIEALTVSVGAFLSDPARFALSKHGVDFAFHPDDGVIGFVQTDWQVADTTTLGLGAYHDSARFQTFDGRNRRGNGGAYGFITHKGTIAGRSLHSFALVQIAPNKDRSLQPLFVVAGLTLDAPWRARADDAVSFGVSHGVFSKRSDLSGAETAFELNYRAQIASQWALRPDLQYIVNAGGGPNALVAGLQLELQLQTGGRP